MPITPTQVLTITCDECAITATFPVNEQGQTTPDVIEANPWLKARRLVGTTYGKTFVYCSDTCEVKGTGKGQHNMPEPKKIIDAPANAAAVQAALQSAKAAAEANAAIKAGQPANIVVSQ